MIPPPLSPDVAAAVARSADRLARSMVHDLGPDAGLVARVEIERYVAGCVAWAARPGEAAPAGPSSRALGAAALRVVAGWESGMAYEAAAWQLTLSALALVGEPGRAGRAA